MDLAIKLLIGFLSGILGGLLGIGGSIIMIPAMTMVFGLDQHLYQGAAMIMNFFVALPAAMQHFRAKAVLRPVIQVTIPTAVVGVLAGVWISKGSWFAGANEIYLSRLFGVFLLYTAGYNVYRLMSSYRLPEIDETTARTIPKWKSAVSVGLPMGLIGGLLGVGGGIVAVPLQQLILKMPLRRAIANSAVTIVPLSIIGAVYKNVANAQAGVDVRASILLALCVIPTAILGGFLGGRLAHTAPRQALRFLVILLMCYAGVKMVSRRLPAETAVPESTATVRVSLASPDDRRPISCTTTKGSTRTAAEK
ncbi:MAG TPA: sulfite exporter TauE/SafE family protein [Phycisphaerae bacterium]|nr:sulfite exporter TauE/SafE family protein [Phycisphaerae bacterium]HRR87165.1 sulfite exporter TauE/SafE family protein [Phycisphaerae bacterium]